MKRYIQHEYLQVSHFSAGSWKHPVHNHNHFEIIFIHRGCGEHCVSGMKYPYGPNTLFLLAPCDHHHFEIKEETEFTFVKFTNVYLKSLGNIQVSTQWNRTVDQLLAHAGKQQLPLLSSREDAEKCSVIFRLIASEWKEKQGGNRESIFFLIQTLLSILKRNFGVNVKEPPATKHRDKVVSIVHYLHSNIYSVERTQLDHLSGVFGLTKNYFSVFFKEHTGLTLRDYVKQYKTSLIMNRLRYSSLSVKEISNEFGFTDLSHFNKFVRRQKGKSPTEIRSLLKE